MPVVSARQMLTWLDGRNNSSFGSISWASNKLSFTIDHAAGANGLRGIVLMSSALGDLTSLKLRLVPGTTAHRNDQGPPNTPSSTPPRAAIQPLMATSPRPRSTTKRASMRLRSHPRDRRPRQRHRPDGSRRRSAPPAQPANGTVTVAPDGSSLSYRPNPDYCNSAGPTDDFTYTLNGGSSATVALAELDSVDDPPRGQRPKEPGSRTPGPPRSTSTPTTPTPTAARRRSAPPPSPAHATVTGPACRRLQTVSYRPQPRTTATTPRRPSPTTSPTP